MWISHLPAAEFTGWSEKTAAGATNKTNKKFYFGK